MKKLTTLTTIILIIISSSLTSPGKFSTLINHTTSSLKKAEIEFSKGVKTSVNKAEQLGKNISQQTKSALDLKKTEKVVTENIKTTLNKAEKLGKDVYHDTKEALNSKKKKTKKEAIKDMATCVYNAGNLGWEIYKLTEDIKIKEIPSIVKRTIICINACQSFKYLKLTKNCGEKVMSAAKNLKDNASLYKILKDHSKVKKALTQLKRDLHVIEKVCVADPK